MTGRKLFPSAGPVFGAWTSIGHPSITEIVANAGVDFIGIDLEHSAINHEQAQRIMAAAQAVGVACLPRAASHHGEHIRRLLDSGADGIIVPNVSTCHEVEQIIGWCKYPPLGKRSYGVARAHGYGFTFDAYVRAWNDRSTLLIQIESIQAVDVVDALLAYEPIDGVLIGPYDLSGSLGIPGQLEHPLVTQACARVLEACQRRGKACGTQLIEPAEESVTAALEAGYRFVVLASDVFVLWKWAERMRRMVTSLRQGASHATRP